MDDLKIIEVLISHLSAMVIGLSIGIEIGMSMGNRRK